MVSACSMPCAQLILHWSQISSCSGKFCCGLHVSIMPWPEPNKQCHKGWPGKKIKKSPSWTTCYLLAIWPRDYSDSPQSKVFLSTEYIEWQHSSDAHRRSLTWLFVLSNVKLTWFQKVKDGHLSPPNHPDPSTVQLLHKVLNFVLPFITVYDFTWDPTVQVLLWSDKTLKYVIHNLWGWSSLLQMQEHSGHMGVSSFDMHLVTKNHICINKSGIANKQSISHYSHMTVEFW
jgi:hypothetical protein